MSKMNKESIIKIIQKIHDSDVKNKDVYFQAIYANFKKKYPSLYEMACRDNLDMSMLKFMLDMMEKVNKNETSQHEASVEVGKKLFNEYIESKVSGTTING